MQCAIDLTGPTVLLLVAGFAGQSDDMSTNYWADCLSQHVNQYMDVKVTRPNAGTLTFNIRASEAS